MILSPLYSTYEGGSAPSYGEWKPCFVCSYSLCPWGALYEKHSAISYTDTIPLKGPQSTTPGGYKIWCNTPFLEMYINRIFSVPSFDTTCRRRSHTSSRWGEAETNIRLNVDATRTLSLSWPRWTLAQVMTQSRDADVPTSCNVVWTLAWLEYESLRARWNTNILDCD